MTSAISLTVALRIGQNVYLLTHSDYVVARQKGHGPAVGQLEPWGYFYPINYAPVDPV